MRNHKAVLASGFAVVLLAGGGTALAAAVSSGPVDSSGVIYGCYTNAALKGTHAIVLQDVGSNCPRGTTPVSWNDQGPARPGRSYRSGRPAGIHWRHRSDRGYRSNRRCWTCWTC